MHEIYTHENGIGLSKLQRHQLEKLFQLKNESWMTTHQISLLTMENQLVWFDALCKEDIHTPKNLVLAASTETKMPLYRLDEVGIFKILHIDWYNRKADVAWDIFEEFRGKGLGAKLVQAGVDFAKDVLGLRKLSAEILENNPASMKCANKAGFMLEGIKVKEIRRKGKYLDSHFFGLLFAHDR